MAIVYFGLLILALVMIAKPFASRKWGKLACTEVEFATAVVVFLAAMIGAVIFSGSWIPALVAGFICKDAMSEIDRLEATTK